MVIKQEIHKYAMYTLFLHSTLQSHTFQIIKYPSAKFNIWTNYISTNVHTRGGPKIMNGF
jgi:hypothetical protein